MWKSGVSRVSKRRAAITSSAALALASATTGGWAALANPVAAASQQSVNSAAVTPNTWVPARAMGKVAAEQTATLLEDGDVLVAGGGTASAELYQPAKGTWTSTGSMSVARSEATATLLGDGQVLMAGGCCDAQGNGLTQAELYDPVSGTWTPTGSLKTGRLGSTATLLPDGEVLVAGGACARGCGEQTFTDSIASAELYNPQTGAWAQTGTMHEPREYHTATLLPSGEVLVAGGLYGCDDQLCTDNASTELYNPATGKWTLTGKMLQAREEQTASLISSGRTKGDVLVAGGLEYGGSYGDGTQSDLSTAELYNPSTATWGSAPPMAVSHLGQTATTLRNGWVLVAGGGTTVAEVYEPGPELWVSPGQMLTQRTDFTATLLRDGTVLAVGGYGPDGEPLASAERYRPGAGPLVLLGATSLEFPTQLVGSKSPAEQYRVFNEGSAELTVSGVAISGDDPSDYSAITTCAGAPVEPRRSCSVTVRFAPQVSGPRSAEVLLVDDAPGGPQSTGIWTSAEIR